MKQRMRLAILIAVSLSAHSSDASVTDFFAGKTISLVIGADVGGGFDAYARAVARQLPRYVSGTPAVIPRNQPGAGSGIAAAALYNVAPKDGTAFGVIFPGAIMGLLLDERPSTQFEPKKFNYLGSAHGGPRICVTFGPSKIQSFQDAQTKTSSFGSTAAGGSTRDYANLVQRIAGAQFSLVSGYKGPNDLYLAMERGELDGVCGQDWSAFKLLRPNWLRDKKANIILQFGIEPDPELTSMGVPHLWSFVKDPANKAAAELIIGQQAFGHPYVLPPGVPAERVTLLRDAFGKVMSDADFLVELERKRLDVRPLSGVATQALIEKLYAMPAPVIELAKAMIRVK